MLRIVIKFIPFDQHLNFDTTWIFKYRIYPGLLKSSIHIHNYHNPIWILGLFCVYNFFVTLESFSKSNLKKSFSWSQIQPLHLFLMIEKLFLWTSPKFTRLFNFSTNNGTHNRLGVVTNPNPVSYTTTKTFWSNLVFWLTAYETLASYVPVLFYNFFHIHTW